MRITPTQDAIAKIMAESKSGTLLYTKLVADLETPVSAMLKLGANTPYSCLLESVEGGNVRGRFSIIALEPDLIWQCDDSKAYSMTPQGEKIGKEESDVLLHSRL